MPVVDCYGDVIFILCFYAGASRPLFYYLWLTPLNHQWLFAWVTSMPV